MSSLFFIRFLSGKMTVAFPGFIRVVLALLCVLACQKALFLAHLLSMALGTLLKHPFFSSKSPSRAKTCYHFFEFNLFFVDFEVVLVDDAKIGMSRSDCVSLLWDFHQVIAVWNRWSSYFLVAFGSIPVEDADSICQLRPALISVFAFIFASLQISLAARLFS